MHPDTHLYNQRHDPPLREVCVLLEEIPYRDPIVEQIGQAIDRRGGQPLLVPSSKRPAAGR